MRIPWPLLLPGKLIRFSGAYTCSSGDTLAGTFEMTDVEVTANGLTGFLRATSGTIRIGRFAALLRKKAPRAPIGDGQAPVGA